MSKDNKFVDFLVGATSLVALVGAGLLSIEAERQEQNNRSRFAEEYMKRAKRVLPKDLDQRRAWCCRRIYMRKLDAETGMSEMSKENRNTADNIDRMLAGV